jgi:hypothetical protein
MSEALSIDDLRERAVSYLHTAANSESEHERTVALRALANVLIDLRESIVPERTGKPDWLGKSHQYKQFVTQVYSEANVFNSEKARITAAVRHHINYQMHERFTDKQLVKMGLRPETLSKRRAKRRDAVMSLSKFLGSDEPLDDPESLDRAVQIMRSLMDRMSSEQKINTLLRLRRTYKLRSVSLIPELQFIEPQRVTK